MSNNEQETLKLLEELKEAFEQLESLWDDGIEKMLEDRSKL
jgi:hypothetical protein